MSSNPWGINAQKPPFPDLKTYKGQINWTGSRDFNGHHDNVSKGATELNRVAPPIDPAMSYARREKLYRGAL